MCALQAPKLSIGAQRGQRGCDDVLIGLIAARQHGGSTASIRSRPLLRKLDDGKPWFLGEMGEGKGPIRGVFGMVAHALKAGAGVAAGMMRKSGAVDDLGPGAWWETPRPAAHGLRSNSVALITSDCGRI